MFAYGTERPFPDKYPHRFGATNEHVSEIKKMTAEELAQVFADQYRDAVSWRIRRPGRGEPFCWFVNGRLDEYGIATLELGRGFLNDHVFREPQRFGIDVSDERVYGILDRAKKKLMVT